MPSTGTPSENTAIDARGGEVERRRRAEPPRAHEQDTTFQQAELSGLTNLGNGQVACIAFALGRAVFAAAPEPKAFVELRGDHNGGFLLSQPDYQQALAAFIAVQEDHIGARLWGHMLKSGPECSGCGTWARFPTVS